MDVGEHDVSPRAHDTRQLGQRRAESRLVGQRESTDHDIEVGGLDWYLMQVGRHERPARHLGSGFVQHLRRGVDPDDRVPQCGEECRVATGTARGVQGAAHRKPSQDLLDQGCFCGDSEKDAATAIAMAVQQLKEEQAHLAEQLKEAKAWYQESEDAGQQARDLQALAQRAREQLHDMQPAEQAEVLALLDVRVTILGEVPAKVREDDRISGWFRKRERTVPHLTDKAWALAEPVLTAPGPGQPRLTPRLTLDAMLHKARTGCTWRDLPERYGRFGTIASAFNRWHRSGLWDRVMERLADTPGTPLPPDGISLPPVQVEGRLDPRLLIGTQATPGDNRSWQHDR